MLSSYGQREWGLILLLGAAAAVAAQMLVGWWLTLLVLVIVLALLAFFRDPPRAIPDEPGLMVSPADGHISSIHEVQGAASPLGEPCVCVRIFLSVLDVHVNRSPCAGRVTAVTHKPGKYLNALNPRSAEENETVTLTLHDPAGGQPVAAVRQVAGLIARRIVCGAKVDDVLQRGQRFGLIKFGSTTELYVPLRLQPQVQVQMHQRVHGGSTKLVTIAAG